MLSLLSRIVAKTYESMGNGIHRVCYLGCLSGRSCIAYFALDVSAQGL